MAKNYYEILEVKPDASPEDVRQAYRRLARVYHPDSGPVEDVSKSFHDIQEAYDTLKDDDRRATYDRTSGYSGWSDSPVNDYQKTQEYADKVSSYQHNLRGVRTEQVLQANAERDGFSGLSYARFKDAEWKNQAQSFASSSFDPTKDLFEYSEDHNKKESVWAKLRSKWNAKDTNTEDAQRGVLNNGTPFSGVDKRKTYPFTIDALESLSDSFREIVLEEAKGPRTIRVKIPAGVVDGSFLRVHAPKTEEFPEREIRISVTIAENEFVERKGLDLHLSIPISISEAINGAEITVPTLEGQVKATITPGWNDRKKLRLKGRGSVATAGEERGDLYVHPYIQVPDVINEAGKHAAEALDCLYIRSVRADIPKSLIKE